MVAPLDELYLVWLYEQNASVRLKSPRQTFWNLCRALFTTEFIWFVPNDDARIEDGRELRYEFILDADIPEVDRQWIDQGVSVLEVLIALSRRCAYENEESPIDWFWLLIQNLGLHECNDSHRRTESIVEEVTTKLVFRKYNMDGSGGGLFPLKSPAEDQTKVEIWYQMCAYIIEHE